MIAIPLEIGDVILAGRFKNKKITVKEIGTDDFGLPTVNGRGIMKIRIQKMMPKKESLLRKLIREEISKINLREIDVDDPELTAKVERYAELANQMDKLKAELSKLKEEFDPLDDQFVEMIDSVEGISDRCIRTKNVLISIKKKGYEAKSPQYKGAFEWLYERVNGTMKKLADEGLALHTAMKKVSSSLAVQYTKTESKSQLSEGWFKDILTKIKSYFSSKVKKINKLNHDVDKDLDKLEKMIA